MIERIKSKLIEAREAYYNNEQIMTDLEFDELEDSLKELDPENEYFDTVGIPSKGEKVKHQALMLSCQKGNENEDIEKWLKKVDYDESGICESPKYNGLTFAAKYDDGILKSLSTRGDGKEGQDITDKAKYIKDIKQTIDCKDKIEIRGELIIKKKHAKYFEENKPLLNICVGLINRKEDFEDLKYVSAIAHGVVGIEFKTEVDKFNWLNENWDFTLYKYIRQFNEMIASRNSWIALREEFEYECDGIVLTLDSIEKQKQNIGRAEHHYDYQIAWKFESEKKETSLIDIEWNVSRNGNVIPIAIFDTIYIQGKEINRASLSNYENVIRMQLKIGDKLLISLANDVIPYVEENVTKGIKQRDAEKLNDVVKVISGHNALIIEHCPSCGNKLEEKGVHLNCNNSKCSEQQIQTILYWVTKNELDQVAESTIRLLYDNNLIRSIIDLYSLDYDKVIELDRMGDKKVKNLKEQIEKTKNLDIIKFLSRLGIELIGEKAIKKLGIKSLQEFLDFNNSQYVMGQNLIKYREDHLKELVDLINILNVQDIKENLNKGESKMKICMTGKGPLERKELIRIIESQGNEFVSSVTKDTNILICEDPNSGTTKLQKALKLGIKLISYEEFFK